MNHPGITEHDDGTISFKQRSLLRPWRVERVVQAWNGYGWFTVSRASFKSSTIAADIPGSVSREDEVSQKARSAATVEYLPPLSSVEEILWCAALGLVPIEDRIAWVEKMTARIEALNERRMRTPRPEAGKRRERRQD